MSGQSFPATVPTRSNILCSPSRTPWDEARAVAEIAVPLLGLCAATGTTIPGCSDPISGVFGVVLLWTASLVLIGELVIRADRRARYRSAVLAEERRRIMTSA